MEAQTPTATPVLGSSLLGAALSHRSHLPEPLSSGSAFMDDQALRGGFRYGEITSIAGAHGTGKTTVRRKTFCTAFHGGMCLDCISSTQYPHFESRIPEVALQPCTVIRSSKRTCMFHVLIHSSGSLPCNCQPAPSQSEQRSSSRRHQRHILASAATECIGFAPARSASAHHVSRVRLCLCKAIARSRACNRRARTGGHVNA